MKRVIKEQMVKDFEQYLIDEEKSRATIEKYLHDLKVFISYAGEMLVDKELVISYKNFLTKIASAS